MKRYITKITAVLLGMLFALLPFAPAALAEGGASVQLPVRITAEGTLPSPAEVYKVRLTADAASNPMPSGMTGGSHDLQLVGPGTSAFPAIEFTNVGEYSYTLKHLAGTKPNCQYDPRSYTVKVTVTNTALGGLTATVTLRENVSGAKPDEAAFHNRYNAPTPPGPRPPHKPGVPTGVDDYWLLYLTGSAFLLLVSGWIIRRLRRKEDA